MSEIPYVHLEATAPLCDVRIMVDVARPLVALNSDVTLTTLLDHHQMAFTVKQAETVLPSSLDLRVVAFYQNSSGASQVVQASMHLPLALVARPNGAICCIAGAYIDIEGAKLLGLGKRAVEVTNEYQRMLSKLSSASQLLVLLLKLKTQMSTEDHKLLQDVFHVDLDASITEGWEEKVEAAICYQLQTGQPDDELPPVPKELTPLKDVTRLKQLIAVIFEKVLDGLRLSQNDLPGRKVDNQSKESDHKEPKPEVFFWTARHSVSPMPGADHYLPC
ncbi:hypothetical protein HPB52_025435 [Rhipicephalus sanguineus]|uniref:Uncharacterized protein n=1 Tax=Rhipicephalus sanguineus TaxID=34632 RepID=A0A9D4YRQ0_RHISA|nr:hypothetical protein HPB52_025435 [Rhipicephalus sanguineus]